MTTDQFTYRLEADDDRHAIESIHAEAFGPGRFTRAAYRLREGVDHEPALSFVAVAEDAVIASVRLTPIVVGDQRALLLGPLAVSPAYKGKGAGKRLVRKAVAEARGHGYDAVILVGDLPYYGPLGFERIDGRLIEMPAPVDPERVLVAELKPGVSERLKGKARSLEPAEPPVNAPL